MFAALSASLAIIPVFEGRSTASSISTATPYLDLAFLGAFLTAGARTLTQTSQTFELPWPVFWSRLGETVLERWTDPVAGRSSGHAGLRHAHRTCRGCGGYALVLVFGVRPVASGVIRPRFIRGALRFSLPLLPYQLTALVLDGADRVILNEFHGEASVAPYALAYAIGGGGMLLVVNSLVHAEAPTFYQAVREQNHALAGHRVIGRIQIFALVAIGMNLVGGPAIRLVYDDRYASSAALLPFIVSGLFFWGVFSLKNLTLLAQKRSGISSGITMATALVNLGLNFVLIPTWGAAGAAVATVIAYALQAVAGVVAEHSLAPVPQYPGRLLLLSAGVLISSILAYGVLGS